MRTSAILGNCFCAKGEAIVIKRDKSGGGGNGITGADIRQTTPFRVALYSQGWDYFSLAAGYLKAAKEKETP